MRGRLEPYYEETLIEEKIISTHTASMHHQELLQAKLFFNGVGT